MFEIVAGQKFHHVLSSILHRDPPSNDLRAASYLRYTSTYSIIHQLFCQLRHQVHAPTQLLERYPLFRRTFRKVSHLGNGKTASLTTPPTLKLYCTWLPNIIVIGLRFAYFVVLDDIPRATHHSLLTAPTIASTINRS